jgi:hypothetical protein
LYDIQQAAIIQLHRQMALGRLLLLSTIPQFQARSCAAVVGTMFGNNDRPLNYM